MIYSILNMERYSLYIHIPFCQHRCGYCDFNTYAGLSRLIPAYVSAIRVEMESIRRSVGRKLPVHTVFFGGGTPSLLPIFELERIMATIRDSFDLLPSAEITLEANPGTLAPDYLALLKQLGVNRLSLGVQSANPDELRLLERQHDFLDVIQSVNWARKAKVDNLSLDLIFGLPYQSLESWKRTLNLALGLQPEHLSVYALTLEHGTPLEHWVGRGLLSQPDSDLAADMYEWTSERLAEAGYRQYEISNWALDSTKDTYECLHNLQYWRNQPYLGIGAGAHGSVPGFRTIDVLAPNTYIQRCRFAADHSTRDLPFPQTPGTQSILPVDRQTEIAETMMMGLRLTREGVSQIGFEERFGQSLEAIFGLQIMKLIQLGLLEWVGDESKCLRLTGRGRLLGNQVFMEFI